MAPVAVAVASRCCSRMFRASRVVRRRRDAAMRSVSAAGASTASADSADLKLCSADIGRGFAAASGAEAESGQNQLRWGVC